MNFNNKDIEKILDIAERTGLDDARLAASLNLSEAELAEIRANRPIKYRIKVVDQKPEPPRKYRIVVKAAK
jgi:hypothetical protein